jgi:hypothetical protein
MKTTLFNATLAASLGAVLATHAAPVLAQEDAYARGLRLAQAVAVPEADRPRRFMIVDLLLGPRAADRTALENGLKMHALLGSNTIFTRDFGDLDAQAPAIAKKYGLTRGWQAVYQPLNGIDKEGAYFSWSDSARSAATVQKWADEQGALSRKGGRDLGEVSLFHIADEPGWYYPAKLQTMVATPDRMSLFRKYLQSKGLQPRDVGAANWDDVRPISVSQASDLPSRRLYYWSARYSTDAFSDGARIWTRALQREFGPQVRTTANWNNVLGRWYVPSPGVKYGNNTDTGPDAAAGFADWLSVGRARGVTSMWSEDWYDDRYAQYWTQTADVLRAAQIEGQQAQPLQGASQVLDRVAKVRVARVGADGDAPEFGGYVVGLRISSTWGGRLKAMSLISRGAKVLQWYTWGPNNRFSNGWSENEAAYAAVASTNRLIGRSEDLLYPGRRLQSRVALMLPQSAYAWDKQPQLPLYGHELRALQPALTNNGWPVDFVDETNVANGDLAARGYSMIFVSSPNLSARAQSQLRDWIQAGGTAIFSPGAATADEYNTPTRTLDEARGIRGRVPERWGMNDEASARRDVTFSNGDWGAAFKVSRPIQPLDVSDASVDASSGGSPVLAHKRFGQGLAVSYGFWPGVNYFDTAATGYGPITRGTNPALTQTVTAPLRLTRIAKPIETGVEGVEAARLDSEAGSAVVLLNWTRTAQQNLSILIRNAGDVRTVESAERGRLDFSREGDGVRVRTSLSDTDVLLLRP